MLLQSLIVWIIVGAIAGWLAGYILHRDTKFSILDVILGFIGAIVGGYAAVYLTDKDFEAFSIPGLVVAVLGALAVTWLYNWYQARQKA